MIVARVIDARSKLATARALHAESAVSTLGHLLDLEEVDENELYQAMVRIGRESDPKSAFKTTPLLGLVGSRNIGRV